MALILSRVKTALLWLLFMDRLTRRFASRSLWSPEACQEGEGSCEARAQGECYVPAYLLYS